MHSSFPCKCKRETVDQSDGSLNHLREGSRNQRSEDRGHTIRSITAIMGDHTDNQRGRAKPTPKTTGSRKSILTVCQTLYRPWSRKTRCERPRGRSDIDGGRRRWLWGCRYHYRYRVAESNIDNLEATNDLSFVGSETTNSGLGEVNLC